MRSCVSHKAFERWSMHVNVPIENIYSNGVAESRSPCATFLDSLSLILRIIHSQGFKAKIDEITIVGADFWPDKSILEAWKLDGAAATILTSHSGTPLLALKLNAHVLQCITELIESNSQIENTFDDFIHWISSNNHFKTSSFALSKNHPLVDWMTDDVKLDEYHSRWIQFCPVVLPVESMHSDATVIHSKVHARIGLIGNPSDGFFGKTISVLINNFWAEVLLSPNELEDDLSIDIIPNRICDPFEFSSVDAACKITRRDGYDGACRLFLATMRVFIEYCEAYSIKISKRGFRMVYQTNIPRQVGLAGSSALVTALLKALIAHYNISESQLPLYSQANLALSAEQDQLSISAGYQDRVVQAYGGCVYMDFDRSLMTTRGYGDYVTLDISLLPKNMWMACVRQTKESGKIHSNVRSRFDKGDPVVVEAMKKFASFTVEARDALLKHDDVKLAILMSNNFNLRREVYGDAAIGTQTLRIVEIANRHGHAAKLSGSGGCVIGLWKDKDTENYVANTRKMQLEMEKEGFIFCTISPAR